MSAILALACGISTSAAIGELINRGNGLIYDTVQNLTWLQDANYAQTSGFDSDGRVVLNQAVNWVNSLEFAGLDDWRLPRNSGQVHEGVLYDTQGELASLFVSMGNVSGFPLAHTGPFQNVLNDYWLANAPAPPPSTPIVFDGYGFSMDGGYEYPTVGLNLGGVWPVRNGDVPTVIDLAFQLPDVVVAADGVNPIQGTISASLDLQGVAALNPPTIAAFNTAFELSGQPTGIALGTPMQPTDNALIGPGTIYAGATELPHTIRFAKDATEPAPAVDGALLVTVPFTVAPGVPSGTYPISFIAGNELTNSAAESLLLKFVNGSITVIGTGDLIPGDYNRNGRVDAADYVVWRDTLGHLGTSLPADGNRNNIVDAGDYTLWRANFGRSFQSGSAAFSAVPEPVSWLLFIAGALSLGHRTLGRPAPPNGALPHAHVS
jgi:hypothetical protein